MIYHKTVIGASRKVPTYDFADLISSGYELKVAVLKDNPDLLEYIDEKEKAGCSLKLVELKKDNNAPSVIDVWVRPI